MSTACSLVVDSELVDDIEVLDHDAELIEGDLTIEVSVGLHDRPVDELLQLHIVQVVTHHHFQNLEQLTVRDETIVVDVVNLESKSEFLVGGSASREGVKTLDELQEGDVTVLVAIEDADDALNQRVVRKLGNLEELAGLEGATLISVDLAEVFVQLLQLALGEVQILELVLLLGHFVAHLALFPKNKINYKSNLSKRPFS